MRTETTKELILGRALRLDSQRRGTLMYPQRFPCFPQDAEIERRPEKDPSMKGHV